MNPDQAATAPGAGAGAPPAPGETDADRLHACFGVLGRVEDQLRFADSKAAFVATLHAFLIGPLAGNAAYIRTAVGGWDRPSYLLLIGSVALYAVLFLVTMGVAAAAVLPRTRPTGRPASKAFFGRIAREFGHAPERFVAEIGAMSARDWLEEIGRYIVDASAIADEKHRLVRRATTLTVPTVAAWLLMVLVLMCGGRLGG